MRSARLRSTLEIVGRKQLVPGEQLPLTPADPAARILEALLAVPIQAECLRMLPEALQPPDASNPAEEVSARCSSSPWRSQTHQVGFYMAVGDTEVMERQHILAAASPDDDMVMWKGMSSGDCRRTRMRSSYGQRLSDCCRCAVTCVYILSIPHAA
jgi:hypothetical protein